MSNYLTKTAGNRLSQVLGICIVLILPAIAGAQLPATAAHAAPAAAAPAKAEESGVTNNLKYNFEIGGQAIRVSGDRPSKFEEFQQVRKGFLLRRFRIASNPAKSPSFFRFVGRGPTEIDHQYFMDLGRYGAFRTTIQYDGSPHLFSNGSKTLYGGGNGVLRISDSIRTTLQNTPDAAVPAAVQNLYASASTISIRSRRETISFTQTAQLTDHWSVKFNWTRYKRFGNQPLGIGSYERVGTPIGDNFRVHSLEVPQQLDYVNDQFTLGTNYITRKWGLSFSYIYSNFKNSIPLLTFDNPFRITDLQATSGGNFDRQKFARGIFALPPSNRAQTIAVSGFVDLPGNTRAAAALSWSFMRQNEQFAPYTLNTAIVTGVPAGLNITSAASLPAQNLNGTVDTLSQDYVIASRPVKHLAINLHFRRFDDEVKTAPILFAGYAGYGESYWRPTVAGLQGASIPVQSEPKPFSRSRFGGEAIWDITKAVSWKVGYDWEGWERHLRQADRTNEHSFSTQIKLKPVNQFDTRLTYKYSDRKPESYNSGVLEYPGLRMFDQSARKRNDLTWQWQWAVQPKVGLSGSFGYLKDKYDENFFGLVGYSQSYGSVDLLYTPKDNVTVYANYSRENYKNSLQSIAKTAVPYDLNNRWNRDERDVLDNFGIGVTTYALREKLMLDLNYVFSNANTRTTTSNPATPAAINVLNSTAYPFPDVKSKLQEFDADVSYQITQHVGLGFRYKYQPFTLDDFAMNNLSPYPINSLPPEQDGRRFLLLDSRYSSHKAHLFTLYLSIK